MSKQLKWTVSCCGDVGITQPLARSQDLEPAVLFARNQAVSLDLLCVYFLYDIFEPRILLWRV